MNSFVGVESPPERPSHFDLDSQEGVIAYLHATTLPIQNEDVGSTKTVLIASTHLTSENSALKRRHMWGGKQGVYTADSDPVAIAVHTGALKLTTASPTYAALIMFVTVIPNQVQYSAVERNGLLSRNRDGHEGLSIRLDGLAIRQHPTATNDEIDQTLKILNYAPLIASIHSSTEPEPLTFNMSNDSCFLYSLGLVVDGGPETESWTSYKLQSSTLYIEDDSSRYEISLQPSGVRVAEVKNPVTTDVESCTELGIPLPQDCLARVSNDNKWRDIIWHVDAVDLPKLGDNGNHERFMCTKFFFLKNTSSFNDHTSSDQMQE